MLMPLTVSVQFSLIAQSCPTLCDPVDWSTPGFPVHHRLPELTHLCSSSQWCHPAVSSSVVCLSSCLQSFTSSGSFLMSQFFASGGQSCGPHSQNKVSVLLLGRKPMTNLDSCIKKQRHHFHCVNHKKLENSSSGRNTRPSYLPSENLYAGQEAIVKTKCGTTDWFQIGKGVHQGCILSPCLFNLYAEYIMWNARLDEAQAGIKISGRNMNNLRHSDDTTFMAESEE